MMVFAGKDKVWEQVMILDANIVEFANGVVAVDRVDNGFIFVSKKGNIVIYNVVDNTHRN